MVVIGAGNRWFYRAATLGQNQFCIAEFFLFTTSCIESFYRVCLSVDGRNQRVRVHIHIVLFVKTFGTL